MDLARSDEVWIVRRGELMQKLTSKPSGQLRPNNLNRGRVADLARLDIAGWLATDDARSTQTESDLGLVEGLGQKLAGETWPAIKKDLSANAPDAAEIRHDLAHHTWCDLLVALIRLTDGTIELSKRLGRGALDFVTGTILASSMQNHRKKVDETVLGLVVTRVLSAIKTATIAHVPVLQLLTGTRALLALRMLAVFACPAPENHPEVRKYALEPLATDGREVITEQVKGWLGDLMPGWPAEPEQPTRPGSGAFAA